MFYPAYTPRGQSCGCGCDDDSLDDDYVDPPGCALVLGFYVMIMVFITALVFHYSP